MGMRGKFVLSGEIVTQGVKVFSRHARPVPRRERGRASIPQKADNRRFRSLQMKWVVKFFSQFSGEICLPLPGAGHEMQQAAGEGIEALPSSFQGLPDCLVGKCRIGRAGLFQKKKAGCGPLS